MMTVVWANTQDSTHTLLKVPASEEVMAIKKAAAWLGPIPVLPCLERRVRCRADPKTHRHLPFLESLALEGTGG